MQGGGGRGGGSLINLGREGGSQKGLFYSRDFIKGNVTHEWRGVGVTKVKALKTCYTTCLE